MQIVQIPDVMKSIKWVLSFPLSSSTTKVDVFADGDTIDKCLEKDWDAFGGNGSLVNNNVLNNLQVMINEFEKMGYTHTHTHTHASCLDSKKLCERQVRKSILFCFVTMMGFYLFIYLYLHWFILFGF